MKFSDLLHMQHPMPSLEDLHATALSWAALNPRSRTECVETCESEAKIFLHNQMQESTAFLQNTSETHETALNAQKNQACVSLFEAQGDAQNTLQIKKSQSFQRRKTTKAAALEDFIEKAQIPPVLEALQDINQYAPITQALWSRPPTSLPFSFRILSRANELYGLNNWSTKLSPEAENFYALLTGNAEDVYHSDFEPAHNPFLQGETGSFVCPTLLSPPYGYNGATGTAPMAACGAFSLKNTTSEDQSRSFYFALSSYNFAAVFLKTDAWTTLFQTTSNLIHSNVMSADFTIPAAQTATILLVSTPYYYRYSTNAYIVQFLQWGLFNVRSLLTDGLEWVF
ncbi:hypothetical protein AGMMS49949_08330 [Alphaproteobacteria bacterium]|nr:hypothetical protein AGMMS49949_08330 [Alphaproteobacteria bacterium]GHS99378.1 hypothetical protein AGMMS50296_7510 [Alphaproteobacteria bacterium]